MSYHIHYFVQAVLKVLQGGILDSKDSYSFDHPPIQSQEDWDKFLNALWEEAALFAELIEHIPDEKLWEYFEQEKYGIYYRNLHGIIEHSHYHLGQIAVIKKILSEQV